MSVTAGGADLAQVGAGFADPILASQEVFRHALAAFSRPGSIVDCGNAVAAPAGVHPASMALLLALLDQDTRLWLSPSIAAGEVAASLRFHTGCVMVEGPDAADFALIAAAAELPPLEAFSAGSEDFPNQSATLVLQVAELTNAPSWRLTGPGVKEHAEMHAGGLGQPFVEAWVRNGARFPRGVDVVLASGTQLCALPRTVQIKNSRN